MKKLTAVLLLAGAGLCGQTYAASSEAASQSYRVSAEAGVAAEQKAVYELINRYQTALNAGDTQTILSLFRQKVTHNGTKNRRRTAMKSAANNMMTYLKTRNLKQSLLMTAST